MFVKQIMLAVLLLSSIAMQAEAACSSRNFSGEEDNVMRAYLAYYGRPADSGGLGYWAGRLATEGDWNSLIQEFGVSLEFTSRYGSLTNEDLVKSVYRQLFGREPESGGLAYYVAELESGRRSLQSITLDVLFGAQNADADIVINRLAAAKHFTSGSEVPGIDPTDFDGNAMAAVLASIDSGATHREQACEDFDAMLDSLDGSFAATYYVSKTSDTHDGICNSDCSLREAVSAANTVGGRTKIVLPAGTYRLTHGEGDLLIAGDVHVYGVAADSTVIDGNGGSRLFLLESSAARLVLSRLALHNGQADYGGAILSKGSMTLDRVAVSGNIARNGGAILSTGILNLFDSTLSLNQTVETTPGVGFGGAIFVESGTLGLYACTLDANRTVYNGGGLYNVGLATIANTVFSNNMADATGGAIDSLGPVSLVGSTFRLNTADDGGALAVRDGGGATVTTTVYEENTANGLDLGGGGAVFNYLGTVSFIDVLFDGNVAYGEGGGAIETNGALTVSNSVFTGNVAAMHAGSQLPAGTAPGFGGAILTIAGSVIGIFDSTYTGNIGGNSGGAIYNDQHTQLSISGGTFTGNQAQGLYLGGASGFGGAITTEGNLSLAHVGFSGNSSTESGGALSAKFGVITVVDSTFTGNSAPYGGAIVDHGNGATFNLSGGVVSGNVATHLGGGLHTTNTSVATIDNVDFSKNQAGTNGGALYVTSGAHVNITGGTYQGNQATGDISYGGAIHNDGTLSLISVTLSGNQAMESGGAIVNSTGATASISNSFLVANQARNGAGIAAYSGQLEVTDSEIVDNIGSSWGGALLNGSSRTTLTRTLLQGNQAYYGGGFSNNHSAGRVDLVSTIISGNSATDGSVLVNFGTVSLKNSTLSGTCNNHSSVVDQGGNTSTCAF